MTDRKFDDVPIIAGDALVGGLFGRSLLRKRGQACAMGLEGIVSKRLTAAYRSGPSRDWIKVKNPDGPAMIRARDHFARLG
jgi:hypothetical protein